METLTAINSQEELQKIWHLLSDLERKIIIYFTRFCKKAINSVQPRLDYIAKILNASKAYISTIIAKFNRLALFIVKHRRRKSNEYNVAPWLLSVNFSKLRESYSKNEQDFSQKIEVFESPKRADQNPYLNPYLNPYHRGVNKDTHDSKDTSNVIEEEECNVLSKNIHEEEESLQQSLERDFKKAEEAERKSPAFKVNAAELDRQTDKEEMEFYQKIKDVVLGANGKSVSNHDYWMWTRTYGFEAVKNCFTALMIETRKKRKQSNKEPIFDGTAWIQKMLKTKNWKSVLVIDENRSLSFNIMGSVKNFIKRIHLSYVEFCDGKELEFDQDREVFNRVINLYQENKEEWQNE